HKITIPEYIDRAQRSIGSNVLYMRTDGSASGDRYRLLLRICEEKKIPVLRITTEKEYDLLTKICNKLNQNREELFHFQPKLAARSPEDDPALERVRSNFESLLGIACTMAVFQPSDLPLMVQNQAITLNATNRFLSRLGRVKAKAERLRPLYGSLYRFALAL